MSSIYGKSNHTKLESQNPFSCINCTGEHPANSQECEMWKKKATVQLLMKKEDAKQKWEELNKLINEVKNLMEMITKETIKKLISTVTEENEKHNQNQEKSPKQRKEKIQT